MENYQEGLPLEDYPRYGRQMVLDGFGLPGQLKLQNASVAVVGAGGLGCPALQYIVASGVGTVGIIDHDHVEISNLQRQILHNEETIGMYKAESAANSLRKLNSRTKLNVVSEGITSLNAVELLEPYDVIVDCTDNAPTRYLLSDTAVFLGKPLVSGAAQKYEGQLCVYNLGESGPCYRCLFPHPPAQETMGTCEDTGILGVVTGIIGNLQALEVVKIITGNHDMKPSMLIFSALGNPQFRTVKLRGRKVSCPACGDTDKRVGKIQDIDYVQFCGGTVPDLEVTGRAIGSPESRISAKDLAERVATTKGARILDVRPETEFGICHLPDSTNVPLATLLSAPENHVPNETTPNVYVVCRLGNDSQIAADALRSTLREQNRTGEIKDLIGGLRAWSKDVDKNFPVY